MCFVALDAGEGGGGGGEQGTPRGTTEFRADIRHRFSTAIPFLPHNPQWKFLVRLYGISAGSSPITSPLAWQQGFVSS